MTTVLGRKVSGEITRQRENRADQWPGERFLEFLDALLQAKNVSAVRWRQYTPYFNDGDPCIFGVTEAAVRLRQDGLNEESDENSEVDDWFETCDMKDYSSGYSRDASIGPEFIEAHPALQELNGNIEHFEDFLEESFGDHAIVTATKDGFDVEYYEHD